MLMDEHTSSVIGLSARERQQQRRREKLLRELRGEFRTVCFCSDTELDRLMKDVEAVAAKTYQRGFQIGFVDTPQMRERLRFEACMGWLRAYVLYVAERPCAFWITNIYRGILYSDFLGFDPAYTRYSPGTYLTLEVIDRLNRDSANAPVGKIDFGVGEAEYKVRLGNRLEQVVSVLMFAPSISGRTLGALHTVVGACNSGATRLLAASGLLPRLKRAWRSRLRPS
jgi:CelD/BcsL family acetyltransferase involved in cellulose biosynthesis